MTDSSVYQSVHHFGVLGAAPMPIRSLPEDESALQQCRAGGTKVLSINVTQAI